MRGAVTTVLVLLSWSAQALAGSRVAIVHPPVAPGAAAELAVVRLRAELESAGFEVTEVESDAADPRTRAESTRDGVFATIEIVPGSGGSAADVWVADHVTGKTVVRRVSVAQGEPAAPAIVAVRAVELLRASLLEAAEFGPRAEGPPLAPDVERWVSAPSRDSPKQTEARLVRRFAVDVGAAAVYAPRLGVGLAPSARAWFGIADAWSGRIALTGPVFVSDVVGPAGTASTRQEMATAEIALHPSIGASAVRPVLTLGAGGYHLHARGSAPPPFTARSDDAWAMIFTASAGFAWRVSEAIAIVADGRAALAAPKPTIRMLREEVAETGRPTITVTGALFATF